MVGNDHFEVGVFQGFPGSGDWMTGLCHGDSVIGHDKNVRISKRACVCPRFDEKLWSLDTIAKKI